MAWTCKRCGNVIPTQRAQNALARGYTPTWCSPACSAAGNAAAYYGAKRDDIAERRRRKRKRRKH